MGDEKWQRKIQRVRTLKIITTWIIQVHTIAMLIQIVWIVTTQAKIV